MNPFEKQVSDYCECARMRKQAESTIENYKQSINIFLKWVMVKNIYDLREINYEAIKEYQLMLMRELNKKYTINTIHLKLRAIRRFFDYLTKSKMLLCNPAEKMIMPPIGDRLPKVILTEKEMERLLLTPNTSTSTGIRDRTILELLYSTGIRRTECRNLKVYDVDYNGGYLRINQGKGGKDRVLPLGRKACDWLKEYLLKVRQKFTRGNPDERALFMGKYGEALSVQSIGRMIKTHSRTAKIGRPVTVHTIRRSCATHMIRQEANPMYVQKLLGHSRIETINRYVKVAGIDLKKTHNRTHPRERAR